MKKTFTRSVILFSFVLSTLHLTHAQTSQIDTLALQDWDTSGIAPIWTITGIPNAFTNGISIVNAAPPSSPIGLGGSWAWNVTSVSGGNPVVFNSVPIPGGYDSVRVNFRLAAMSLSTSSGGPDDLDYVLVEYSLDTGTTYFNRLRIRGALANNSFWGYDATGVASVFYLPPTETLFQPLVTGLQTTLGYSECEIVFPGSVGAVQLRITPRSSSSTDTWLIDNVMLTGESYCVNSNSSISETVCNTYTSPGGSVYTSSGVYNDTISNVSGCDSIITINLTVNPVSNSNTNEVACGSYLSPSGNIYTASGIYNDTIPNVFGCDSVITTNLTINMADTSVIQTGDTLMSTVSLATYQWINCTTSAPVAGATSQMFIPTSNGSYALVITDNGCTDTSGCITIFDLSLAENENIHVNIYPNPVIDYMMVHIQESAEHYSLKLFDESGRMVLTSNLGDGNLQMINVQTLAPGLYIVSISDEKGSQVFKKLVVE